MSRNKQGTVTLKPKNETLETVSLDPTKEFLAGGILSRNLGGKSVFGGTTLSSSPDDLMKEFGHHIYTQMAKDPKVYKCVKLLKVDSLQDGVELLPCLSDNDPDFESAKLVSDFCSHAIKGLRKPLKETLSQMLDALVYGHKIAEIVYKTEKIQEFGGTFLTLDSIKPKPIGLVKFVVDDSFNVIGAVGSNNIDKYSRDNLSIEKATNIVKRGEDIFVKSSNGEENLFIASDKIMYLTIDPEDDDPRGRSILRSAYTFWNLKQQIIPEILRFILTCSIPMLIGFTPEEDGQPILVRDAEGNIVRDSSGKPIAINKEAALRDALVQARNSTALALKGGSQVKEIGGTGSGLPFYKTLEIADAQIESAILLQTLATSEGRYSSRAQSQTHMDTLENLIWDIKKILADMLTFQLLRPLIKYNFGSKFLKFTPVVSLGDTERRNFSLDGATVATLYAAGYLSEDQKRFTDQMLGLPVRDSSYDPLRNVSPDERLKYSQLVLSQTEVEANIKKTREAANSEKINQIVALQSLLQSKPGANGEKTKQSTSIASEVIQKINSYTLESIEDIQKDKLVDDTNRIFQTITGIENRSSQALSAKGSLGKIEKLDAIANVDTTLPPAKPVSGSGETVPQPYISTKGSQKTSTFSRNKLYGK
ncbi:MAG TPA: DUF935 family protein [Leptospiraceae bacterium]|nr:DUF935 family protein [Leptospiraceae bacterium]